jgi:hypothetical protein
MSAIRSVEPWELLSCVVAELYLERRSYELGLVLLELLGRPRAWHEWAEAVGSDVVEELEVRLSLRSLDEFMDLVDNFAAEVPRGCSRHALLLLHRRDVALRCQQLPFHVLVDTYDQFVAWLRGEALPVPPVPVLEEAMARLDHEEVRRELARLAERSTISPAESALRLAETRKSMGAPFPAVAHEAAALAAELGNDALLKRAAMVLRAEPVPGAVPPLESDNRALLKALESRDEAAFLAILQQEQLML